MVETSSQSVPSFFQFVKIVLHINSRGLLPRTVRVGLWRRVSSLVLHLGSADGASSCLSSVTGLLGMLLCPSCSFNMTRRAKDTFWYFFPFLGALCKSDKSEWAGLMQHHGASCGECGVENRINALPLCRGTTWKELLRGPYSSRWHKYLCF